MKIRTYEKDFKNALTRLNFNVYEVMNAYGQISIAEKECYSSSEELMDGLVVLRITGQENNHDLLGFSKQDLCQGLALDVDRPYFDTLFIHPEANALKQEWNRQVNSNKLSINNPVYLYDTEITDFLDVIEIINKNDNLSLIADEIVIKTKNSNMCISIDIDEECIDSDFEEINIYTEESYWEAEKILSSYASEVDTSMFGEGTDGIISLEKLNEYINDFGGLDLIETHINHYEVKSEDEIANAGNSSNNESLNAFLALNMCFGGGSKMTQYSLLPVLKDKSNHYLYELINKQFIVARKIVNEDENYWYTKDKQYEKINIKNVKQFNPNNFTNLYSDNFEDLISTFNNNLDKFLIY